MLPTPYLSVMLLGVVLPFAAPRIQHKHRVPLPVAVPRILADPAVSQAHWGISVVRLNGTPIYKLNDGQFFNPASNAKLFTTATAYALLPSGLTFTTLVSSKAPVGSGGKVSGDITIYGVGDPNMSARTVPFGIKTERPGPPLAALENLADQIVAHGVRSVSGDVVGDDTWFVYERYGPGWSWDDLQWGYGAPVSALTVNDNEVYLNAVPAILAGQPAVVSWLPLTPYYTVDNSLLTAPVGDPGKPGVERAPGSMTVRLFGRTALGQPGLHTALAIEDPAEYAARSLQTMLQQRGVQISGKARAQHRLPTDTSDFLSAQQQPVELHPITIENVQAMNAGPNMLGTHVSPPLGDDLVITNKVSQNLHAEITLRTLGKLEGADGSLLEGTRVVRQFLISAGVAAGDVVLYDGCGLSIQDLATPRAFTTLLAYAARQSWGEAFRTSLPVGGVDGSLSGRFKQPLLDGKVFAKTGTLGEARALSGYLVAASGQTVAFSIMCTDHKPSEPVDRAAMDKIVAAIAESN
ncbi:MAG TPA: D-alanyl-D-alanine carboxypeptidase/D-alanyl-D-alanine-endopeptidase [Acidobacteriaceae bacterium]|nr:D-alanyl-D-alanine carboxypeptidase/D-alanyl-D-alanine-endopeptidase [Acidobacteriaceae bacterium]